MERDSVPFAEYANFFLDIFITVDRGWIPLYIDG